MKRIIFPFLLCFFLIPSAGAQNAETQTKPSVVELKMACDRVVIEAKQLYRYEKSAWVLEDVAVEKRPGLFAEMGGWFPVFSSENSDLVKGVFFNQDKTKVLVEASYNFKTRATSCKEEVRDLTPEEIATINAREKALLAVRTLEEELPSRPTECTFNTEVIPIGQNLYRVYWMLGTAQNDVIPFGCDFSYDCDSEGNVKAFRRYHKTYIPAQLKMDDGSNVDAIYHSHLSFCPFIAPTDIALFMLYGAGVSELKILSTVYDCIFTFNPSTFTVSVEEL